MRPAATFDRLYGRENNFDALRFLLALLVILTHSYGLLYGPDASEPLVVVTGGRVGFGDVAVNGFFVISGFLITASWMSGKGLARFLTNRAMRIYPGIAAAIAFCLFVAAPLGVSTPWSYLRTLSPELFLQSLASMQIPEQPVFEGQAYSGILNLSLWTIRYECLCYLMIAALGLLGLLQRRSLILIAFAAALGLYLWQSLPGGLPMLDWRVYPILGRMQVWPRFLTFYLAGTTFYLFRDHIPARRSHFLGALAALAISGAELLPFTLPIFGTYILMYSAFSPTVRLHQFGCYGDFSYGLYIYACPIQQLLIRYFSPHLTPLSLFLWASLLTLAFAFASWHLIESPALEWARSHQARSIGRRDRPPSIIWNRTR